MQKPACRLSKEARSKYLTQMRAFTASGRISITDPTHSITASFTWQQTQDNYRVRFYSPFSSDSVTITGIGQQYKIISTNASQAELHLEKSLPLAQLSYWLRGLHAQTSNPNKIAYDQDNQTAQLEQDGWLIEYQTYKNTATVSLPEKLTLSDGHTKAKILIKNWQN